MTVSLACARCSTESEADKEICTEACKQEACFNYETRTTLCMLGAYLKWFTAVILVLWATMGNSSPCGTILTLAPT